MVLEGLDGAGTTTLAGLLTAHLEGLGRHVCATAEPTTGPFGTLLGRHLRGEVTLDPQATALVFTADRRDHLDRVIRPALGRGDVVVCDRYLLSTLAYQGAFGVDREAVLAASAGFDVPDLTVVLDVPDALRAGRIASRGTVERYEDPDLAVRLAESYSTSIDLLRAHGHRIGVVDASADAETVLHRVLLQLDALG